MATAKKETKKRKKLYEGKAKILYEGPEPGTLVQHFKDDATAFNAEKKGTISGKGILNNRISERIMTGLENIGVPTHLIRTLNMREQLIKAADIIPLEVVVHNAIAGSLAKRLDIEEGTPLPRTVIEFHFKSDELGDPIIGEDLALGLGLVDMDEIDIMKGLTFRINDYLRGLFEGVGIELIDYKLEFGRILVGDEYETEIILADEISPDSCRLWDLETKEKMDKDRFRRDLGKIEDAYQEVARRLGVLNEPVVELKKEKKKSGKKSKS